jgi:hypothetical protein
MSLRTEFPGQEPPEGQATQKKPWSRPWVIQSEIDQTNLGPAGIGSDGGAPTPPYHTPAS